VGCFSGQRPRPPPNLPPRCAQGEGRIGALRVHPVTRFCGSDGSRDDLQHRSCGSDASRDDLRHASTEDARFVPIVIPASLIQAFAGFAPSLSPSAKGRVGVGCFSGRGPAPLPTSPRAARKGRGGSARFACTRQPDVVGATEVAMICGNAHRRPRAWFRSSFPHQRFKRFSRVRAHPRHASAHRVRQRQQRGYRQQMPPSMPPLRPAPHHPRA